MMDNQAALLERINALEKRIADLERLEQNMSGLSFGDSANLTPFSRLRVAGVGNRSDTEFIYDKQPLLYDDISSGTGTATHQSNARDILLAVGGTGNGATGGMRKHYWVPYTAGNGQLIFDTGTADNAGIGGGTMYVFLRSTVSGSTELLVEEAQANWNINTVNDRDWSKSNIFGIDFQSLKVGRIRYYMDIGGEAVLVHDVENDNVRNTGYWQSPSLPPYGKIYNTATETVFEIGYGDEFNGVGFRYVYDGVQSSATARFICETVKSEGGVDLFDLPGVPGVASNQATARTVSTTFLPLLSIRVAGTFNSLTNRMVMIPLAYELQADNPVHYKLLYRPVLVGASWTAVSATYSGMEYDVSATSLSSPGVEIDAGYLTSGTKNSGIVLGGGILGRAIMSLGSSGTADILTLAAIRTGTSNASAYGAIKWKEIR